VPTAVKILLYLLLPLAWGLLVEAIFHRRRRRRGRNAGGGPKEGSPS